MDVVVHFSVAALSVKRAEQFLFAPLTLALSDGQLCQIQGPNGSGKSTLLRTLCGLITDYDGVIAWQRHPIQQHWARFRRAMVYLGHRPAVRATLSAEENLRALMALSPVAGSITDHEYRAALQAVGLAASTELATQRLSAGQQRRIALARLLLRPGPLWILDEPFAALDQQRCHWLEALIEQHCKQGGIVILVSHQPLLQLEPHWIVQLDGRGGQRVIGRA